MIRTKNSRNYSLEYRQSGVGHSVSVGLVDKHLLVTAVGILGAEDLLVKLPSTGQKPRDVLEQVLELREAKVGDLGHLRVDVDLKRSDGQGNVGRGRRDVEDVVERLAPHVERVDSLDEVPARHGDHALVDGELELPGARLVERVDAGEPVKTQENIQYFR